MAVNSALLAKTRSVSRAVCAAGRKGAGGERAVSGLEGGVGPLFKPSRFRGCGVNRPINRTGLKQRAVSQTHSGAVRSALHSPPAAARCPLCSAPKEGARL